MDRMLAHLRMIGALGKLKGVIIGRFTEMKKATEDGAPQLHDEAPNNIVLEWACGKDADVVEKKLPWPADRDAFTHQVPVVIVGRDVGVLAPRHVDATVLDLFNAFCSRCRCVLWDYLDLQISLRVIK